MSDLPILAMCEEKRNAILEAIGQVESLPENRLPGDVTTDDIIARYHVSRDKARQLMKRIAAQHPDKYKMVNVVLDHTYHNRAGFALRMIDPTAEESSQEQSLPFEAGQLES